MTLLVLLLVVGAVVLTLRAAHERRRRAALEQRDAADLAAARRMSEEDVTRFGEDLQRLDTDVLATPLDDAARQDYQRALDSYEAAKEALRQAARPEDVRHVTRALEDGRYAVACVKARTAGQPLPVRRPPCFFNPAHGPSTVDIEWAPPGGRPRQIPVCAADVDRVSQGAEPDVRTVPQGLGRVPYWQGGPAYSPWASGYFGGYAASGLLPGFLLGSLLAPGWGGGFGDPFDSDPGWDDGGYDDQGDGGSDDQGDGGSGDGGGGDSGDSGDGGGWDGGGFGDFGDFGSDG